VALLVLGWTTFANAQDLSSEVQKGRYLATAGNCATCHTVEGGAPFAGGVAFPTPFGTIYSTNITQDVETGLGGWSLNDFRAAIRKGVRPDGEHLYPAFPYTSYTKLSDRDIASLYAYLKTIAAVSAPAKENELKFPFGWRALMRVWNALFFEEGAYAPVADRSAAWNRGAYLVQGLGHCSMCHSPRNFLGAEDRQLALSGGIYNDKISDGTYRPWAAVNLTPAKDGLAAWNTDDIVAYLKTGVSGRATTFGPMNDVVMNSLRHLDERDVRAIATYLQAIPAKTQSAGSAPSQETLLAGETVYTVHCGTCHLPSGRGAEGMGTPLAGSAVVQAPDPSSLINIVLYGPQLPPAPFSSGRDRMEPFGDKLTDEETAQLATYLRSSWGNAAGAVTAAQVAQQR
jgi:mono/diheme cytochrome c family protein